MRRKIETCYFVLNSEFDIEQPIAKSLSGIQKELEQKFFDYNLGFL